MVSKYLNSLSDEDRETLITKLYETQNHICFICEQPIDLVIHKGSLDVDHIQPSVLGGKDDPSNFALTHLSCNRTKQASDLRIARVLSKLDRIANKTLKEKNRTPNLSDILLGANGSKYHLNFSIIAFQKSNATHSV